MGQLSLKYPCFQERLHQADLKLSNLFQEGSQFCKGFVSYNNQCVACFGSVIK